MKAPTPYLAECVRGLKRELRKLPRGERVDAACSYRFGVNESVVSNYPGMVKDYFKGIDSVIFEEKHKSFVEKGRAVGNQFGKLEAELFREFLCQATNSLSSSKWFNLCADVNLFLSRLYETCGRETRV